MSAYDPLKSATAIAAAQQRIIAANKAGEDAIAKYKTLVPGSPEADYQLRTAQSARLTINAAETSIKGWKNLDAFASKMPSLNKVPSPEEVKSSPYLAQVGDLVDSRIAKLPTIKSPEIIKKQIEAEVHKKKVEAEVIIQTVKALAIDTAKTKLKEGFAGLLPKVPAIPKLPILDPKILAQLAYAKAKQEVADLRQKVSRENLKKSKEAFTFPMKPPTSIPKIPKIPELPKLPDIKLPSIPKLPELPKIPKLPDIKLPSIPKVPQIPELPKLPDIKLPTAPDIKIPKITDVKLPSIPKLS
jgi:hypothetical protein